MIYYLQACRALEEKNHLEKLETTEITKSQVRTLRHVFQYHSDVAKFLECCARLHLDAKDNARASVM